MSGQILKFCSGSIQEASLHLQVIPTFRAHFLQHLDEDTIPKAAEAWLANASRAIEVDAFMLL
jgi:hypothetical protein